MDNEEDKLTIYSFEKASELYEEKVKKLRPKGIKNCAMVLNTRVELRIEVEHLNDTFQDLLVEQDNLQLKENELNDTSQKIILLEKEIRDLENDKGKLDQKKTR
jgi:cell division protein FtsB